MHHNLSDIIRSEGTGLIGMVHVGALPGTPHAAASIDVLVDQAIVEAKQLESAGFDAIIIENMHDAPYVHGDALGPEIVAAMTRVTLEVRNTIQIPIGVQILSGGNKHALSVAQTAGAQFIRCENFVFAHVADEGLLERAEAGGLLRYRKMIEAQDIRVFCDIKKKHASHAITADIDIVEIAHGAEFFGADGLIVTGPSTGKPTDVNDVRRVRESTKLPVLVGSGVTPRSFELLRPYADACIVGSALKHDGFWANPVDPARAAEMIRARDG